MVQLIQKQKYSKGIKSKGFLDVSGSRLAIGLNIPIVTQRIKASSKTKVLINYGLSSLGANSRFQGRIINHPDCVRLSSNKLLSFDLFEGNSIPTPTSFTSKREVVDYLSNPDTPKNSKIVCRTLLSSTNGKGIVIVDKDTLSAAQEHSSVSAHAVVNIPDCRLYTIYFPKKWELRLHVAFGEIIYIQQKRKLTTEQLEQRGITERNKYIRNLDNGYIYSSHLDDDLSLDFIEDVGLACLNAIRALQLDFGAVDVIINKNFEYVILEVNSAPGLEGSTLEAYVNSFKRELSL